MIVLKPTTNSQNFPLTIKGECANRIILRKEGTNEEQQVAVDSIVFAPNNVILTAKFTNLVEGEFYQFLLVADNGIVCRERAFVTSQPPKDYSINKNEYIIYE